MASKKSIDERVKETVAAVLAVEAEADGETGSRAVVATAPHDLANHRERMRYEEYRKHGLQITPAAIESTIKHINRRIQGTQKSGTKKF